MQCNGCTKQTLFQRLLKVSGKIYHFYLKINSIKVFSLLLTSVEEATDIEQYFADSDLVRGFSHRDKATMAEQSEGKEKYEFNDNMNDITNLLEKIVEQHELLIAR